MDKYNNFFVTVQHPKLDMLKDVTYASFGACFLMIGGLEESSASTPTPHLHCVVHFAGNGGRKTFPAVRKLFEPFTKTNGLDVEKQKGKNDQAIAYATKEVTKVDEKMIYQDGVMNADEKGGRSDLLRLKDDIDSGKSELDLWGGHFGDMLRYSKGVRDYRRLSGAFERKHQTELYLLLGVGGAGKSRLAYDAGAWGGGRIYPKQAGAWWCGYDAHEIVVIDDFMGIGVSPQDLCRLADRYPLLVETKGGNVPFVAKKIIITSNFTPSDWWSSKRQVNWHALARRVSEVRLYYNGSFEILKGEQEIFKFCSSAKSEIFGFHKENKETDVEDALF